MVKVPSVSLQMLHGLQSFCHLYTTHILANAFIVKYKGQIAEAVETERTKLVQEGAAAVVFWVVPEIRRSRIWWLPLESVDVYILFSLFASFLTFAANRLDSVQIILLHIAECALFIFTIFSSGMVHRFLMGYSASIQ